MYILKKNEKYHNFKIFIKEKNKKNPHINWYVPFLIRFKIINRNALAHKKKKERHGWYTHANMERNLTK
jgi:hypothetical protein